MMMENKFVAALKANGKILREVKDTVYIPFGAEYSILLKNLNSVRALLNIQIDGQEVCPDGFVLDANKEVDLERFIKDGNLTSGNRFKFIERTSGIEQHRGIKAEDGIIRISFKFEKPRLPFYNGGYAGFPVERDCCGSPVYGDYLRSKGISGAAYNAGDYIDSTLIGTTQCNTGIVRGMSVGACAVNHVSNDVGITVPGSISDQKFTTTTMGPLESQEHVIVLRILGVTESGKQVVEPVTVKAKPKCVTCGRVNKASNKFCSQCGTSLEIV